LGNGIAAPGVSSDRVNTGPDPHKQEISIFIPPDGQNHSGGFNKIAPLQILMSLWDLGSIT
jgi:hypothetical protein